MIYTLAQGSEILIAVSSSIPNLLDLTILELHIFETLKHSIAKFSAEKLGVNQSVIFKDIEENHVWMKADQDRLKKSIDNLVKFKLISVEKCNNISYLKCLDFSDTKDT